MQEGVFLRPLAFLQLRGIIRVIFKIEGAFFMTKIDIYSGFLGAGKTTLIKKLIAEGYQGQKLVLIENEFGEIGIDGGFLQEAGAGYPAVSPRPGAHRALRRGQAV